MNADSDKIKWIYDSLCDEKSKYIFENRRKYAENGNILNILSKAYIHQGLYYAI